MLRVAICAISQSVHVGNDALSRCSGGWAHVVRKECVCVFVVRCVQCTVCYCATCSAQYYAAPPPPPRSNSELMVSLMNDGRM